MALELEPESALALNNLGCALTADRRIAEAVDILGRAVALSPDFPEAWYNLAKVGEQGKLAEAAAACRRAFLRRTPLPQAHITLGNALLQAMRQFEEGIALSPGQALKLNPSDAEAYSNLGNVLRSQGKLDQAISPGLPDVRFPASGYGLRRRRGTGARPPGAARGGVGEHLRGRQAVRGPLHAHPYPACLRRGRIPHPLPPSVAPGRSARCWGSPRWERRRHASGGGPPVQRPGDRHQSPTTPTPTTPVG